MTKATVPTIHECVRIDNTPHPGFSTTTEYRALCGYVSENRNEFRKEKWGVEKVTCAECVKKLGNHVRQ